MLFFCGTAHADRTIWYVHPDSALNTIQAGLDSCADNDIVLVAPGTYVENIVWPNTQAIHLISELGPDTTIIDGNSAGDVVMFIPVLYPDTATVISGFTIQNGLCGVRLGHNAATIHNNVITDNSEAGVRYYETYGGTVIIINNTIVSNALGVYSGVHGRASIEENNIVGNTQGGIHCLNVHALGIIDNFITGNTAYYGGGIWTSPCESSPLIYGNTITNNSAKYGGGIWAMTGIVRKNIIEQNSADSAGGGVYGDSPLLIDSCTIANNQGDGVCVRPSFDTTSIHYCNVYGNVPYGVRNIGSTTNVNAEHTWWGDPSGPGGFGPGIGDSVSAYVDYDPWLTDSVQWVGVEEQPIVKPVEDHTTFTTTIFSGSLQLPEGKNCKVFDITGRVVVPDKIKPGIYFIEIDGVVTQKVVKVR